MNATILDPASDSITHDPGASSATKRVLLLKPRGFCAGVVRAIDIVQIALETFGAPIYVRKEIVHNSYVVTDLAKKGAIFVNELDEVPEGARVIYSAHGVSPAVRARAKERGLKVIDATCPLVTKVHLEAIKFAKQGYSLVLVGHRDHEEVEGTQGEAPDVTQVVSTVEEVEALDRARSEHGGLSHADHALARRSEVHDRRTEAQVPQDRRPARAGHLLRHRKPSGCGEERRPLVPILVLVVGSRNSSNSNRLVEVSMNLNTEVAPYRQGRRHSAGVAERQVNTVAITAGASAPEVLVQEVVAYLQDPVAMATVDEVEVMPENVRFGLPPEIVQAIAAAPKRCVRSGLVPNA